MRWFRSWIFALLLAAPGAAASAATTLYRFDVTVTTVRDADFASPIFTYQNLSSPGVGISTARIHNGPPWDFVSLSTIVNPAGGTRTLLEGQEAASNPNDGCTPGLKYGFTGFDPSETFRFSADPEGAGCLNAVVSILGVLEADILTATVVFDGGPTLSGRNWVREAVNPSISLADHNNRRYRLSLETSVTVEDPPPPPPPPVGIVPEPSTWAMMTGGFGLLGSVLRRRRVAPSRG